MTTQNSLHQIPQQIDPAWNPGWVMGDCLHTCICTLTQWYKYKLTYSVFLSSKVMTVSNPQPRERLK